jgi:hypothetical protein
MELAPSNVSLVVINYFYIKILVSINVQNNILDFQINAFKFLLIKYLKKTNYFLYIKN